MCVVGNIQPGTPLLFGSCRFFPFLFFFVTVVMLLHGHGLSLTLLAELFHDSNDTSVAEALEDKAHAVAALAELVNGLGGGEALNASLNALCA